MNRVNSTRTVAVSGLIIMALTVALFFLLTDADARINIDWWAFGFMIFAELAATAGIVAIHNTSQAYRPLLMAGGISVLSVYAVLTLLLSLIYMNLFRESYKWLITLQLILLAAVTIVLLALWSNAKRLIASNSAVMYAVTAMGGLASRAETLYKNHKGASYEKSLERLYEDLRYCDNTVMTQADQRIHQQLYDLESLLGATPEPEAVERQIRQLLEILHQRGAEASQTKRGTI